MSNIEYHIKEIIKLIGDNPERSGLKDTPQRYARACREWFSGYRFSEKHIEQMLTNTAFDDTEDYNQLVIIPDIWFYSHCEHHIAPFEGYVHIAYLPKKDGKVIGLSKASRLVEILSRRLQIQERLTEQIAEYLSKYTSNDGVMVIISAVHSCVRSRGIKNPTSKMMTSAVRGVFKEHNHPIKDEFLQLMKIRKKEQNI